VCKVKFISLLLFIIIINKTFAEPILKDNFQGPEKWTYIADDVMGGVSTGSFEYKTNNDVTVALLSGKVSTENKGGFIQSRRNVINSNLEKANFVRVVAKGNNQKYFIHLRTTGTFLPWQYYAAEFIVEENFKEFIIPITNFKKSGFFLGNKINAKNITSIGIVAFGRDHYAELYIKEVAFLE